MRRRDFIAAAATFIAAPAIIEDADARAPEDEFDYDDYDDADEADSYEAASPQGPLHLVINTRKQRIYVFVGETLIGWDRISTGRRGYRTTPGTYSILEKRVRHFSNLYDNAPMHYMQRLTWAGMAIHAGRVTGRPASHGCIRLTTSFAKQLFAVTSVGTTVVVV